jgi:acyl-CoA synthetase (AMP-forming)/AMP-acid ligase II
MGRPFANQEEFSRIGSGRIHVVCSAQGGRVETLTAPAAIDRGRQLLCSLGIDSAERVALLLLPHSPELYCLHLALVMDGHLPAILPWPTSRIDAEKYQRNLLHQLAGLPAARLLTLPQLAENLGSGLPFPVSSILVEGHEAFQKGFGSKFTAAPPAGVEDSQEALKTLPEDALFLQFSGGTTGTQKCVVVTERMLRNQLDRLRQALHFSTEDTVVSWLPMYHDMGLIACLWLPLWCGGTSVHMAAGDWLLAPEKLFQLAEQYRGTFCWLPNFAFSYLAQRREAMCGARNLATMRGWINCSEPVRLPSMRAFVEAFSDWGVREGDVQASYAMAETVFAATQTRLGAFPRVVARHLIGATGNGLEQLEFSMPDETFVSSGELLPDTKARIVDTHGSVRETGTAGEIQIQSPSSFSGYWGRDGFQTDCFTSDGWYRTGDYGFLRKNELYVIGRLKDLIIVGGQNVFPEDVEFLVNEVDGVYPGRVVAFGVDDEQYGTQSIGVVAELRDGVGMDGNSIEREVQARVLTGIGIAPRYVRVVPERWIVKSTAGKISRKDTREKFMKQLREQEVS